LIPEWIEISNVLWPKLQAAVIGETSPKDALDSAAKEARKIMIEAGYL
jgi:multiple sugar transport system substrate-binding protein